MCRWGNTITGPLGVFVAALVLPGGFLLLAWAPYRWILRQGTGGGA